MTICLMSWEERAGKSVLSVGLARWMQDKGKKVGYLKPVAVTANGTSAVTGDVEFVKQALLLDEPIESLVLSVMDLQSLSGEIDGDDFSKKLKNALKAISKGKDIILVEGCGGLQQGGLIEQTNRHIAEILDAKVIVVMQYGNNSLGMATAAIKKCFKERLQGVVVNQVPATKASIVKKELSAFFGQEGMDFLGTLNEERKLQGISVGDVVTGLEAEVLCCPEYLDKVIENIMVGAMCVDSGQEYFNRKSEKLVVARSERTDMHMAALATHTRGLLLTGEDKPKTQVLIWAEEKKVPVLFTGQDTLTVLEKLEELFIQTRLRHEGQIASLVSDLSESLDLARIQELG
ncbi:MAG: AAA family ATPase [Chloroflexota bacterium]|nr:AAA family ATPase [Chloroflexota bacterium]